MRAVPVGFVILALALEEIYILLNSVAKTTRIPETIAVLLAAGSIHLIAVWRIHLGRTAGSRYLIHFIIASATVFRITLVSLHFPTTDDAYRYRWEGRLQASGGNPYQARPIDPEWQHLRDEAFTRVGLKEFKGGYGPAWELLSRWWYQAVSVLVANPHAQVFWFKVPAIAADLALLAALLALLRSAGGRPEMLLVYAWSPLPAWEFWANGHNDALPVLSMVLALLAFRRGCYAAAGTALGLGIALKFWPAILLPAFLVNLLRARAPASSTLSFVLSAIAVPTVCFVPYWSGVWENVRFMSGFLGGWRNNDSIFGLTLWATGDLEAAKRVTAIAVGGLAGWLAFLRWPLERTSLWTLAVLLLLSSNVHPWYLTWLLPLICFNLEVALLLWAALMPIAYWVWIGWQTEGIWLGSSAIRFWVYVPVFALVTAQILGWLRKGTKGNAPADDELYGRVSRRTRP